MQIDLDKENAKHIETLNKEMGEVRDCIAGFQKDNAVAHENIYGKINNITEKIDDVLTRLRGLGYYLAGAVIILIISMVITNIIK